jgi:PRTRC genetic system protein A
MFPIAINDGVLELPKDDIVYIIAKEGIFLKKKLDILESIVPVQNISFLQSINTMARMNIPKIPADVIARVILFFREIYKIHRSEAIVLIFYNKDKRKFKMLPPFQKVSGGSLDYNRTITVEGYDMIGTIHSHGCMSAFHSGTDQHDEKSFDGLHITIGSVDEELVSISTSIVSNGTRFIVETLDYMELKKEVDIDEVEERSYGKVFTWDSDLKKMVEKENTYKVKKYDKRFSPMPSKENISFNKEWLKRVEKQSYTVTFPYRHHWKPGEGNYGYYGYGYGYGMLDDGEAWEEYFKRIRGDRTPAGYTYNGKDDDKNKIETDKPKEMKPVETVIKDEDDFNPCESCVFRDSKIDWVIDQITTGKEDEYDENKLSDHHVVDDLQVIESEKGEIYLEEDQRAIQEEVMRQLEEKTDIQEQLIKQAEEPKVEMIPEPGKKSIPITSRFGGLLRFFVHRKEGT